MPAERASAVEKAPAVREAPTVRRVPLPAERARDIQKARIVAVRRAKLRAEVTRYATNHTERLRAALKTAPESAKPALLQAIADSKSGYQRAIESLD